MIRVAFIGDTHGKWWLLPNNLPYPLIHVGDLQLGFKGYIIGQEPFKDPKTFPPNFHFIRGNHDNPEVCRQYENYLGDYGCNKKLRNLFFVSGGFSIDKDLRVEGLDWWPDEELSQGELYKMMDLYEAQKPDVVVSHECPASLVPILLPHITDYKASRTAQALDSMLYIHRPRLWVFGHHHRHVGAMIQDTRFVCLDEGEVYHTNI